MEKLFESVNTGDCVDTLDDSMDISELRPSLTTESPPINGPVDAAITTASTMKVLIRVRPVIYQPLGSQFGVDVDHCGSTGCTTIVDANTIKLSPFMPWDAISCVASTNLSRIESRIEAFGGGKGQERVFKFPQVFGANSTQKEIYAEVEGHVEAAVEGFNTTIIAYGPQSGGKTYTMTGSLEEAGVIPRAIDTIFNGLQKFSRSRKGRLFEVEMSYVEFYNNMFKNLLQGEADGPGHGLRKPTEHSKDFRYLDVDDMLEMKSYLEPPVIVRGGDRIDVRESPVLGVFLSAQNLRKRVKSADEVIQLISKGDRQRSFSQSGCETSTR
jgi:hypothetical protein